MRRTLSKLKRRLTRPTDDPRLARLETRVGKAEERINNQDEKLRRQHQRMLRQKEIIDEIRPTANRAHSLFEILGSQLGSVEERLQALTESVELGIYDATDPEKADVRSLLEEVRDEHRRIRVRFGTITRYEERVRRLESALAEEVAAAAALAQRAAEAGLVADAPTHGVVRLAPGDSPPVT